MLSSGTRFAHWGGNTVVDTLFHRLQGAPRAKLKKKIQNVPIDKARPKTWNRNCVSREVRVLVSGFAYRYVCSEEKEWFLWFYWYCRSSKKKGEAIYPRSVKWGLLTWIRWIMHTIFLFIPLNPSEVPPPLQLPNLIQPPLFGGSPFMLLFYHWLFSTSLCSLSRFPDSFVRGIS